MRNEMIERVAKAIGNIRAPDLANYRDQRLVAMVAIEAMREPTEEMVDGADDAFHEALKHHNGYNERAGISPGSYASAPFSQAIWPAMIDAALAIRASPVSEREEG